MWALGATVLTEVIKGVSSHLQNNAAPQQPPHYSSKLPEPAESRQYQTTSQTTANNHNTQKRHYRSQASTCSNCSSHSDPPQRSKPKTNKQNKGSVCIINVPENGNFEVSIKKTQADFAKMSMRDKSKQKTNKTYSSTSITEPQYYVAKPAETKKTPAQKTWMYLGRIKIGTSKDNLQNYLTVRFPKRQFKIEQLPLYRDGKLPCFKVLVDNAILDEFQDENFWPVGVKITKYHSNFKKN